MSSTKKKKVLKITGAVTAVILLFVIIGMSIYNQTEKIAIETDPEIKRSMEYDEVQPGDEATESPYVEFDAFFLRDIDNDGYAESIRGTCRDISETDTLYININVLTNGTFKNGTITINGENINLQTALVEDTVIKQNYISSNTTKIELKDMTNGTQKLMYGTVKAPTFGSDTTLYSKVNTITLTGIHEADNGETKQVTKTVSFTVDWHGDVTASIYSYSGSQDISNIADEENGTMTLSFYVTTKETAQELILKDAVLEGTIPDINGYSPISVETTSSNVTPTYNDQTGEFVIKRESTLGDNGVVSNTVSRTNTFYIQVTYPYEAYESLTEDTLSINVPVKAYYDGWNNPNDEFYNPIQSNIVERTITFTWRNPTGTAATFNVTVGTYRSYDNKYVVSKEEPLKLYNGTSEETEDLYTVRWSISTGNTQVIDSIRMKESETYYSDRFLDASNDYYNMSDYTSNVGIYFSGATNTLGDDGWINVIDDETGDIIHTFTSEDWGSYSSSNPYTYDEPVKHIRIETSAANQSSSFYVYNIKEINDNVLVEYTFTRAQFDNLQYIYTYLAGSLKLSESDNYADPTNVIASALYEAPVSKATITVDRDTIGTQTIEEDIDFKITTSTTYYNYKGWTNGVFLIELPVQILDVEINEVTSSNSNVQILAYEVYEENGQKFIRVETENETEATYTITVNTDLTADPRAVTEETTVELYGYNENCDNYVSTTKDVYDIDGDENVTENVNYATDLLYVVSPSSLLTNEQATNYNEANETVIAPQIATIDKSEADTATINVSITNNYTGTISEVTILGKIPFVGNTFAINGTDLGSEFTTEMTSDGITVSGDMEKYVTVYYSENETPTNDLTNEENGWKTYTEVNDWSKIKTYLIDLGSYVLKVDEKEEFSYKIKLPSTVQYNQVTYSTHAVYFSLDTDQGKYRTQTETTKLGFRIERKYNFTLQKVKENTEVPVQGATFSITSDDGEETRIGTTNNSGNISIENLYVDKTYTLKEIRTPSSYEAFDGEIQFRVTVKDDELLLEILSGEEILESHNLEQATSDSRGVVSFVLENTPKYKIEITKKDAESGETLQGIKYKLEGEGLGTGITVTTNSEGKIVLTGLSQDVQYTLRETQADGYYVEETPIVFVLENNDETLYFRVISGEFTSTSEVVIGTGVTGTDAQDTVSVELTDEKIPTYNLQLTKYAEGEDTLLPGAQYIITGEGFDEDGETFTTDEYGILTIEGLYEYVEEKNITGEYTLKELTPPEGYALDEREFKFKATRNESEELELEILGDDFLKSHSVTNADSDTAVINIELEDEPLFEITKVDEDYGTLIPNAKFVIYEINESYEEVGFAKDINGNEVGTLEDGVYVVETDENGVISYGLQSGLYKAVEIEAPEGYELAESEDDRTYYFGIDKSKPQETDFGTSFMTQVSGSNWEKIESVYSTADDGFVVSGYFVDSADFNQDGLADIKGNTSDWSGFIAKYDEEGNFEFAKSVCTSMGEVKLHEVVQTSDGGYVAVGYYTGSGLTIGDATTDLEGKTYKKALIIKFGSSGEYQWCAEQEIENVDAEATAVGINLQENVLVGITYSSGSAKVVEYGVTSNSVQTQAEISDSVRITGIAGENNPEAVIVSEGLSDTTTGEVYTYQSGNLTEKLTLDFNARDVARLDSGKYVIVGAYTGTAQSTTSRGTYDGIISVYDLSAGIESSQFVRGTSNDIVTSVEGTTDGGYIIGGYTYSSGVDLDNDGTNDGITSISGSTDGFVIKYKEDGTQEWLKQVQGSGYDEVTDVTQRDNEYLAVGYFNSATVKGDISDSDSLTLTGYTDSFIFNYGEIVTAPEIPESLKIKVNNNLKTYKITTEVEGGIGGTISGEGQDPYETVEHGKDSTLPIVITPEGEYKIEKITINDEEYSFTVDSNGSVTLPGFTEMTEDKHIVVSFSNTISNVIVHHYVDGTEVSVAPDETLVGTIGDIYETSPKMGLDEYELKTDGDGNHVIPSNATGEYTRDIIEVTYYYVEKEIPLVVHHYIEGTEDNVPLAEDETYAEDVTDSGKKGESYQTSAIDDSLLSEDYELVDTPEDWEGTYEGSKVEVTYYYKRVEREVVITKYDEDETTPLAGVTFEIASQDSPEEALGTYTTNSKGQISITLKSGDYVATEIAVPDGYDLPENNTTEFSVTKANDVINLSITNTKTKGTVITHHYIVDTTDRVPDSNGEDVQDVTYTETVGKIYATKEAEDIAPNYEFVSTEGETSGTITEGITEVIYYYQLKDPSITPEITKVSNTEIITDAEQTVSYTINYKVTIDEYIGTVKITIVDELPYEIDTSKEYDLKGGSYSGSTITWTEDQYINTYDENGTSTAKEIEITKTISLVYKDVDTTKENITNKVTGTVKLETPEEEIPVTDEENIPTEYPLIEVEKEVTSEDSDGDGVYLLGETIEYKVTVTNKGNETLTNVVVDDESSEEKTGTIYTLEPEESKYVEFTHIVTEDDVIAGKVTNVATVGDISSKEVTTETETKITVIHEDKATGEVLDEETIEGKVGELAETYAKNFDNYKLVEGPDEPNIIMDATGEQVVRYFYAHVSAGVIEKHIDITTEELLDSEGHEGYEGDPYDIQPKTFEGYDLVEVDEEGNSMLPDNATGTMARNDVIEVIYYYKKIVGKVIENHIDITTGDILETETHEGNVGDAYDIRSRTIDGYDLVEVDEEGNSMLPDNATGTMVKDDVIEVNYYYIKKAEVEVKYLEKGTEEELAESETIKGHIGDSYTTEQKEIEYYKFVEKTDNAEGEMTEEKITVIYYYEKQIFNLEVDKWVERVEVNGEVSSAQTIDTSDNIYKVEVHREEADTTNIKVTYKIRITNTGEIEGTVELLTEVIPEGYTFYQEDNTITWNNNNGVLTTSSLSTEVISPGEYKEIEITLRVNTGSSNFGQKENTVILTEISNPAGYEDIDEENNTDTSTMLVSVATGLDSEDVIVIVVVALIILTGAGTTIIFLKRKAKKEEKQ